MNSYRDDESEGFDIEDLVNLAYSSDHSSDEEPPMATCPTAPPSREDSDESDESDNDASSNEDDEVPPAQAADFPVEIDTDSEVEKVLLPPSTQRPAATPIETTPGPATLLVETPKEAVRGTSTRGRGGGRGRGRGRGGSTPPCTPRNERPSSSFSSPSSAGTSSGGTRTSTPASSPGSLPTKSSPSSPSPESRPTKRKRTLSQLSVPSPSEVATNMGESIVQAIAATATPVPQEKTYKRKPKPAPAATESDQSEAPESEAAQQPVPATSSPKTTSPKKASRAKPTKKTGHWTREEMMLLFHEVFPRKYDLAWDAVSRAVGRDEAECSAKVPALISELEDFLKPKRRVWIQGLMARARVAFGETLHDDDHASTPRRAS